MKKRSHKTAVKFVLLGLLLANQFAWAVDENCLPAPNCAPCGEVITNMPLPSQDCRGVNPFENYLATSVSCMRSSWNGFYVGTGFGYGTIQYDLRIPNVFIPRNRTDSYVTEYVNVGYAYSTNGFFIGAEAGYHYNSLVKPIFYEDMTPITFNLNPLLFPLLPTVTVTPCEVRLDINAQHHGSFDLMPGFVLTPCLTLFGRAGFEYTNYAWRRHFCIPPVAFNALFNGFLPLDIIDLSRFENIRDRISDSVVDFRLGAGANYSVGPHLSFNVNFVHIFGSESRFKPRLPRELFNVISPSLLVPVATLIAADSTLLAENRINPRRNEILLGMTLSF